jgi:hypothetical protein
MSFSHIVFSQEQIGSTPIAIMNLFKPGGSLDLGQQVLVQVIYLTLIITILWG